MSIRWDDGAPTAAAGGTVKPDHTDEQLEQFARALPRGGRQLPAGRHGLTREFVASSQRDRLIDAMACAVAEKGYAETSVKDVLERAGVSRRTFYEHFSDKEECFVASYETLTRRMLAAVLAGYRSQKSWPRRIRAGIEELLRFFASEPAYARAGVVEVLAAGPEALKRRDAALQGFQIAFDPSQPEVPDHGMPPIVIEATLGGIMEVMYARILGAGPAALLEMRSEMTYLALAPFIGHKRAARYAEE